MHCPCGLDKDYLECCGLYIEAKAKAPTAVSLMRSRYSAYSQANIDYIAKTMRGMALKGFSKKEAIDWANSVKWISLKIINTTETTVEYIATYEINGSQEMIQEKSIFKKSKGEWFYVGKSL